MPGNSAVAAERQDSDPDRYYMEDSMTENDYICKDQDGNVLVLIDKMSEKELSESPLFTHCLAVVKVGDEYLLGRNKWRNRYEIFGGRLGVFLAIGVYRRNPI